MSTGWLATLTTVGQPAINETCMAGTVATRNFALLSLRTSDHVFVRWASSSHQILSTSGHYYLYGTAVSELYARCYGIERPVPRVDASSDVLEVFGAKSNPSCLGDTLLHFEPIFRRDDYGRGLTFLPILMPRGN
jgi:hypothetical protein